MDTTCKQHNVAPDCTQDAGSHLHANYLNSSAILSRHLDCIWHHHYQLPTITRNLHAAVTSGRQPKKSQSPVGDKETTTNPCASAAAAAPKPTSQTVAHINTRRAPPPAALSANMSSAVPQAERQLYTQHIVLSAVAVAGSQPQCFQVWVTEVDHHRSRSALHSAHRFRGRSDHSLPCCTLLPPVPAAMYFCHGNRPQQ
jgi:hypothetical protein